MAYEFKYRTSIDGNVADKAISGITKEDAENLRDLISKPETRFIDLTKYANVHKNDPSSVYMALFLNLNYISEASIKETI